MAVMQSSPCKVILQRTGSSLRKITSGDVFYRGPSMAAKKAAQGQKEEEGRYRHTVNLPKTTFGMRANALVREPEIQKLWDEHQVFKRVVDKNDGGNFVLHDGPPYANGVLHIGHALNKILKDIINRYKLLRNYKVHFVPGWDCHGLPIELKGKYHLDCCLCSLRCQMTLSDPNLAATANPRDLYIGHGVLLLPPPFLQSLDQDAKKDLTSLNLRAMAAKFAKETVKAQMSSFQRFGVWADWNNPYLTLDPEYEAAQIEVFGEMALKGYIYRGRKPVHWSPSSRTALAEAELEYQEHHVSRSIYALFKIVTAPSTNDGSLEEFFPDLCLAIWTTTPWTIPANAAVAVNARLEYAVVEAKLLSENVPTSAGNEKRRLGNVLKEPKKPFLIVALDLLPTLETKWGIKLNIKKTLFGSDLENCRYAHPINNTECPVVVGGDYITTESGTGLVHTAPGHGQEDYVTWLKYGPKKLGSLYSPVDDDGKFTEEAGQFKHKYPYDWRTKKPTIFRATEQWFASLEGFREAAMDAIGHVKWIPAQAENRISAMISSRSEWGLPIPVFYHVTSKEPLMNKETIDHVKSIIAEKGSDAWYYMTVKDLLPEKYRSKASEYEKGTDTMDVWFDSGSSWAAVLGKRDSLSFPADLYLEGTDQHRGWFQSSLLTSIATKGIGVESINPVTRGRAPYSSVLTHGFVLDEKRNKMSKFLGNVVNPRDVIEGGQNQKEASGYGADILRLWVSSVDYTDDVTIGPNILRQMSDIYRKLRGTLRYLLSNLHDWDVENAVSYHELPMIDRHALFQLENVVKNMREGYESYQFYKIFQIIQRFVTVDLSNFYFDVAKDRLYVGGTASFTRRSCQTILAAQLLSLTRVIAPILPHLAEDVWQHLPFKYTTEDGSVAKFVFEAKWPALNDKWLEFPAEEIDFWGKVLELRTEVNKVLEVARTEKLIGSSLEAKVYLHTSDVSLASRLLEMCPAGNDADNLHRIFLTSQVEVVSSLGNELVETIQHSGEYLVGEDRVWIGVSRAEGSKCERCWNYSTQVGSFVEHPTLCSRCFNVVVADTQLMPPMAAVTI
ncbi:Aminoacyl-tRNA synthetase, class Ia [Corchorus olitorius]|uniref:isoleucine--tRNA ligase n=1 Tax=Corchorus olitorius TaxID=93759 RepID=A0A1R3GJQ4_9ROSI|nr:Aminoacyl-tRNA synthetase, class Ia [Corchorus olitorius]